MLSWVYANLGTIIITIVLVGVVTTVVVVMRHDKEKGKCTCGGSCGHCPMGGSCHHGQ